MFWIGFGVGLTVGGTLGVFIMACITASKN